MMKIVDRIVFGGLQNIKILFKIFYLYVENGVHTF